MRELGSRFPGDVHYALFMLRGSMLVSKVRVVSRGGKVSKHCQLWWSSPSKPNLTSAHITKLLKQAGEHRRSFNARAKVMSQSTLKELESQHWATLRNVDQRSRIASEAEYQEQVLAKNAAVRPQYLTASAGSPVPRFSDKEACAGRHSCGQKLAGIKSLTPHGLRICKALNQLSAKVGEVRCWLLFV